jgi:hypothetical protein
MTGVARNAACGLFGLALLAAGTNSGALAQDDDSLDQKVISNVLSTFGLKSNQGDIDYKERSPLVLPPRVELPPPETNPAAGARNWPVDPDIKRRKDESRRAAAGRNYEEESRPVRPSELNVGTPQRGRSPASPQSGHAGEVEGPNQLGYKGGVLGSIWGSGSNDKPVQFTEEPPRSSLTEPPTGYQTPSPNQPYTAKSQGLVPGVSNFFDRMTPQK